MAEQPFLGSFVDEDDGRYVRINGIIYPALLASCRSPTGYVEDMRDNDYPADWCRQFGHDLQNRAAAVLVCDADDYAWTFLGLFQVHDVKQTNFLGCRIGALLARLQLTPGPS